MPDLSSNFFQSKLGLSSIELSQGLDEADLLPEDSSMDPIDAAVEARLTSILEARDFEWMMLDALRPEVADHSILKPGTFHVLRQQIMDHVESAMMRASSPEEAAELSDLVALLGKLGADHSLGEHYRYALLKG